MNRDRFFPAIRASVFRGFLNQGQVDGLNDILDAYELEHPVVLDYRPLAYMLATAFHETAATMQPIEEYGKGRGLAYGRPFNGRVYYGRGYVQLTWLANYQAMSSIVGVDLVTNPERALVPSIAFKIMSYGMENGVFTGHKLADYITPTKTDFFNCRRIINGVDRAAMIADYAQDFLQGLDA